MSSVTTPRTEPAASRGRPGGRGGRGGGGRGGRGVKADGKTSGGAAAPPAAAANDAAGNANADHDDQLCVICLESLKTHVLVPCGHLSLCGKCVIGMEDKPCPVCRTTVVMSMKVFH